MNVLTPEELQELIDETKDHLWSGRFRMALITARQAFEKKSNDPLVICYYAWALLDNSNPVLSLDLANQAVELAPDEPEIRLYRGYLLMRMGIFEGAMIDIDFAIEKNPPFLPWIHINKARALAGLERYFEALEEIDTAIKIDKGENVVFKKMQRFYRRAAGFLTGLKNEEIISDIDLLEEGEKAFCVHEYWFALWAAKKVLDTPELISSYDDAVILELKAMFALFQVKPAMKKAQLFYQNLHGTPGFDEIFEKIKKFIQTEFKELPQPKPVTNSDDIKNELNSSDENIYGNNNIGIVQKENDISNKYEEDDNEILTPKEVNNKRVDYVFHRNNYIEIEHVRTFDLIESFRSERRTYLLQFNEDAIRYIAVEFIFKNLLFNKQNHTYNATAVWYLNDFEVGRNQFLLDANMSWQNVVFVQSWGTDSPGFWRSGQGKVEIFIEDFLLIEKWFLIGHSEIIDFDVPVSDETGEFEQVMQSTEQPSQLKKTQLKPIEKETLENQMQELDTYIGMKSVKDSMKEFISYLEFLNERKKLGLKTQDNISVHLVFTGNPGTGKTTIARLLAKIFKSMGLLENGHLVEVDRSSLVGQYIGETAQKTEKIIEQAIGGVLFIDEAYTLVKKGGGGQDFGQEAIDVILKRMEDKGGEFVVIVAGYPDEMKTFLESNPGLQSRFTHFFNFEDYTPDELIAIFKMISDKEEYKIEESSFELLLKEFTRLYRKRDKNFGNARMVRKMFNEAKMKLSKRYLTLSKKERTKEALTTITSDEIKEALHQTVKINYNVAIDEDNLKKALNKLETLIGLSSVKKEINELIKLARYYSELGENIQDKFSSHIIFLGNPGTGKTTVARIFGEIYSALGILPKGHLVEIDRQGLVASFVGQTAQKTKEIIDKAIGGTLFIDEAYTLSKKGDSSDFGKEAIDILLKRMEDDRGKFICIAAGYTEEMKAFIESNPGLKSRFTKVIEFEDYTPEEMYSIVKILLSSKNMKLADIAFEPLRQYFMEIYRTRDSHFGNARIVRNLVDAALKNHLLRIADLSSENRTDEIKDTLMLDDIAPIIGKEKKETKVKIEGNRENLEKHLKELHILTGLDSVKRSVDKLISGLKVAKLREERGMSVLPKNLHAVFTGNPGTGKTTVARLLSCIYKEMGLIDKGHLIEVDRSALVAGYQGQTSTKTDKIIEQAIGGTLFIDEAYTLSRGSGDFGQEAIETLLKRMEDFRGQFIVIVAGYPKEMKDFIDANPGLQSRFTNYFHFEDYTARQMLEITAMMGEKSGYKLDEGALQLLLEIFNNLYNNRDQNFGNARTVRNILYKAIGNQEERILTLSNHSDYDLMTINIEDVEKINIKEL